MSTLLAGSWLFDLQHLRQQLQDSGGGLLDDAGPIAGEVESLAQLLALNPLLKDFKAVKNGNVWCTSQNMFQETLQLGQMIREFHLIFSDSPGELDYLFPLT